jgi:hypothetical protein
MFKDPIMNNPKTTLPGLGGIILTGISLFGPTFGWDLSGEQATFIAQLAAMLFGGGLLLGGDG